MVVVAAIPHGAFAIDPDDPENMAVLVRFSFLFEWTQVAPQSCCSNDAAFKNMKFIFVTPDTFQSERLRLNCSAPQNMPCMSLTLDTSHFEMSLLNVVAWKNRFDMS